MSSPEGARAALLAFVALSLLASNTHASFYCIANNNNGENDINHCVQASLVYVALGLLLSLQVVVLAYLIGEVLNFQPLKGWYKNEVWEALKSIGIVAAIFAVIMMAGGFATYATSVGGVAGGLSLRGSQCNLGVSPSTATANITDLYQYACQYLQNEWLESNQSYFNLLGIVMGVLFIQGFTLQWYTPILSQIPIPTPWPPFVDFLGAIDFGVNPHFFASQVVRSDPIGNPGGFLQDSFTLLLFPMIIALGAQYQLLLPLMGVGLGVFLPLGIILRAFPFLRFIGGSFIAIAVGASIIYPIMLVFFNAPMTYYFRAGYGSIQNPAYSGALACGAAWQNSLSFCGVMSVFFTLVSLPFQAMWAPLYASASCGGSGTYCVANSFFSGYYAGIAAFMSGNLSFLLDSLYAYDVLPMLVQMLLFTADIIVVITLSQNIAQMLGGQLRLSIGKMKLT